MLRVALIGMSLAACIPPSTSPGYFYAPVYYAPMPIVPLASYPPPPFYDYSAPVVADVQLETPSLAVRALAGKISEAASGGDCTSAIASGDELEKLDSDSHHAMLAIDQRYAACIRGF